MPALQTDTTREAAARRQAHHVDLCVVKNRSRDADDPFYQGYMLVDAYTNCVVAGSTPRAFSLSLDELEAELTERLSPSVSVAINAG